MSDPLSPKDIKVVKLRQEVPCLVFAYCGRLTDHAARYPSRFGPSQVPFCYYCEHDLVFRLTRSWRRTFYELGVEYV